jgi:hypothetical protein
MTCNLFRPGRLARAGLTTMALSFALSPALADGARPDAAALREFIGEQVGGLNMLKVPARNKDLPLPRVADGTVPYRYELTEAKRYLGKLLFHDPVRTARIDVNTLVPKDLPSNTHFGGTFDAGDALIRQILPLTSNSSASEAANIAADTAQTGSCGSCHIGEAAGKAGQQLNFNVGGEGRGYTDAQGNFFPRRRPQQSLARLRSDAIFPGDVLVDALPTLTDIWSNNGVDMVTTPAYYYHLANPADPAQQLIATGRLDQLDSVARMSPAMVGFAFNNRLLLGGFAGEPQSTPGSLNPFSDPAQENLTLLLLDAHRMIGSQAAELRHIDAFVKLFRDAFPQEAAADSGNLETLISDDTEFRAQAAFLRTVVTRNTPFDRFLAGDNHALTPAQQRGARLFFTPAADGAGGAGCFSCHSGPMLNKQTNDADVTGVGAFVEENFINVGIGDHPVQALNALARGHLDPTHVGADGFPYHAEDTGRQEVTHDASGAYRFRVLTLRQLKDGRNFMHNGSFTNLRDVVEYFNAGVPQDPTAGAAATLSPRFTNPRGAGYPDGLGLSDAQVDDLTDFLLNALYDPGLVKYDPASPTDTLQPNERDLSYSKYRPDLAALGAIDGMMLSRKAIDDNDPLARRDQGLEFADVTSQASVDRPHGKAAGDAYRITNTSASVIDTHLLVVVSGLPPHARVLNASGTTRDGNPYLRLFLKDGVLEPGASVDFRLQLSGTKSARDGLSFVLLSGQGKP